MLVVGLQTLKDINFPRPRKRTKPGGERASEPNDGGTSVEKKRLLLARFEVIFLINKFYWDFYLRTRNDLKKFHTRQNHFTRKKDEKARRELCMKPKRPKLYFVLFSVRRRIFL